MSVILSLNKPFNFLLIQQYDTVHLILENRNGVKSEEWKRVKREWKIYFNINLVLFSIFVSILMHTLLLWSVICIFIGVIMFSFIICKQEIYGKVIEFLFPIRKWAPKWLAVTLSMVYLCWFSGISGICQSPDWYTGAYSLLMPKQ